MAPYIEKLRPKAWDEIVGQEQALSVLLANARANGDSFSGLNYLVTGPSGTGKTTFARLIASEVADPCYQHEVHASKVKTSWLDSVESELPYVPWGRGGRAYIINEAHYLSKLAIGRLLDILEGEVGSASFIFTTTTDGAESLFEDSIEESPFRSRCVELILSGQGDTAKAFAKRAKEIAEANGLDGRPLFEYELLVAQRKGNFRQVIVDIMSGRMQS